MSIILQMWSKFYEISLQVLTKKKTLEGYIKIHDPQPPNPRSQKVTANLSLT